MKQKNTDSLSEQYVKKSNRWFFFLGIGLLIVFMLILLVRRVKPEQQEMLSPVDYATPDVDLFTTVPLPSVDDQAEALLKVQPDTITMENVMVGTNAEIPIMITAEKGNIILLDVEMAEVQKDGFDIDMGTCQKDMRLAKGTSCTVTVLWNPLSLRYIQNLVNIKWREDNALAIKENVLRIPIKAQSSETKSCVVCETGKTELTLPRSVIDMAGTVLGQVDNEGYVTLGGQKYKVAPDGLVFGADGKIIGVTPPEMIPVGLDNQVLGSLTPAGDVVDADGQTLGKMLGDGTIVSSELKIIGAGVPRVSVLDTAGVAFGTVQPDGRVMNAAEESLGHVLVDGSVVNDQGKVIGAVRPWGGVIDLKGNFIGVVIGDGSVVDEDNQKIGRITSNKTVIGQDLTVIGALVPQGVAFGRGCQALGKVTSSGKVQDAYGQTIGYTLPDGTIVDANRKDVIGSVLPQGVLVDTKMTVIGLVDADGRAVDMNGSPIGCPILDGTVMAGKTLVGRLMKNKGQAVGYGCLKLGSVYPDGRVINEAGEVAGYVTPEGHVRNLKNTLIGTVVPVGLAVDASCQTLGVITADGMVQGMDGTLKGCMTPENDVMDTAGLIIGSVPKKGVVVDEDGGYKGIVLLNGRLNTTNQCVSPDNVMTPGMILDDKGNPMGWEVLGYKAFDMTGAEQGEIQLNGLVRGTEGFVVGHKPLSGTAFSTEGLILGRYSDKIGAVLDGTGALFAKVLPSGALLSGVDNKILGGLIPDQSVFVQGDGTPLGRLYLNGLLVDAAADVTGAIRADGSVIDKNGLYLGRRLPVGEQVLTFSGVKVGTVTADGFVVSPQKVRLGTLVGNGLFLSTEGQIAGAILNSRVLPFGNVGSLGMVLPSGVIQNKARHTVGRMLPSGLIIGTSQEILGQGIPLTGVINPKGAVMGWVAFDGSALNAEAQIGTVLPEGVVLDKDNKMVGMTLPSGIVVDAFGRFLGSPMPDGTILGHNNALIGDFKGSDRVYNGDNLVGMLLPPGMAVDLDGALLGVPNLYGEIRDLAGGLKGVVAPSGHIMAGNDIVGTYVPLTHKVMNDKQQIVGFVGPDGGMMNTTGALVGRVVSPSVVLDTNNLILGTFIRGMGFAKGLYQTALLGNMLASGILENFQDKAPLGMATMTGEILSFQKKVIGKLLTWGIPLDKDMKSLGALTRVGTVLSGDNTVGDMTGDGQIVDLEGADIGHVMPTGVYLDRIGGVLGHTFAGSQVINVNNEVVARAFPAGMALAMDSSLVGGLIPTGPVVNDRAEEVGIIRADGKLMTQGKVVGTVSPSGEAFADAPDGTKHLYVGQVVSQGVPVAFLGGTLGTMTYDGTIEGVGDKTYRVLDDGFVLEPGRSLAGRVVPFGKVLTDAGQELGTLTPDGDVMNPKGDVIGHIGYTGRVQGKNPFLTLGFVPPAKAFAIQGCAPVGLITASGDVYDGTQKVVGKLRQDGTVVDEKGSSVGYRAYPGPVFSASGIFVGQALWDGTVVDTNGEQIGCIQKNHRVTNLGGNPIGMLINRGPVLCENKTLGRVLFDGQVLSNTGKEIGHILGDGKGTVEKTEDVDVACHMVPLDQELLFNKKKEPMGSLGGDGTFYNLKGDAVFKIVGTDIYGVNGKTKVASISESGEFLDLKGHVIEDIILLYDLGGRVLGLVSGCDVLNDQGEKIGTIKSDGSIMDLNGTLFASIRGGDELYASGGSKMGALKGTSLNLSSCGLSESGTGAVSGRRIYLGGEMYTIADNGSLLDDTGVVIGYMGNDGKPYRLTGGSFADIDPFYFEDATEEPRQRPDFRQHFTVRQNQLEDINTWLIERRAKMKTMDKVIVPDERILAKAKNEKKEDKEWDGVGKVVSTWKVDMSRMLLKDKAIPAVLVHSLDSRYTNVPVTAIVERHIYSEAGRNILIPAGSRLIGRAESGAGNNHVAKINISWDRLIRPDGSAFIFSGTSGDAQGRGGVAAYLDDRILSAYGKPFLLSVVTSVATYLSATGDSAVTTDSGDKYTSDKAEALADARENLINTMDQIFQQLVNESMNAQAIVYVPSGTRLTVYSTEDLWLRSDEDDEEAYLQEYGKQSKLMRTAPTDSWEGRRPGQEYLAPPEDVSTEELYTPEDQFVEQPPTAGEPLYNGEQQEVPTEDDLEDRTAGPVLPKEPKKEGKK